MQSKSAIMKVIYFSIQKKNSENFWYHEKNLSQYRFSA